MTKKKRNHIPKDKANISFLPSFPGTLCISTHSPVIPEMSEGRRGGGGGVGGFLHAKTTMTFKLIIAYRFACTPTQT